MKKYTKEQIQETIENYKSLVGSLSKESPYAKKRMKELYHVDKNGHYLALILPKRMYDEIKEKIEFIDKCIPQVKREEDICVLEAKLKGLDNNDIREHFVMDTRNIAKRFDNIIDLFYKSKFNYK